MSDSNARIQLELVDGPAQKALADFIKSSGAADKALGGLNKSLSNVNKGVGDTSNSMIGFARIITDDLGNSGATSLGRLSSLFSGPLLGAIGGAIAAGVVLKSVLDMTFLAERNDQVANSFEAIARSAGLAGDSLKQGLLAATNGLADDDDVLRAANKSIIELGSNANKIPEIMEIARRSTALFGGDLIQNFENLSQALASGNTRALRSIGLVIDADSAQQKYAASLGVTVAQLSDAGKKQAVTNAALEQAKEKFANVDESSNKATQALQRFKVSVGEVGDTVAKATQNSSGFGALLGALSNASDTFARNLNIDFGKGLDQLDAKLQAARLNVDFYSDSILDLENRLSSSNVFTRGAIASAIEETKNKLAVAKIEVDDMTKAIGRLNATKVVGVANSGDPAQINSDAVLKAQADAAKNAAEAQLALVQSTADMELAILQDLLAKKQIRQDEFNAANAQIDADRLMAQREVEAQRFLDENEALQKQRAANLLTDTEYYARRDALATQYAVKATKANADELKSKTRLTEEKQKLHELEMRNASQAFGNFAVLMQTQSRELFAIGKAAALAQAGINISEAVTKAWAQTGIWGGPFAAAATLAAGAVQIANIANTNPSFASGGIVPGTSYSGDNVTANVNSGEMILNRQQQSNLFNQIGKGGGSDMETTNRLLAMIANRDEQIVVNIGGKTVVDTLRSEVEKGRRFA